MTGREREPDGFGGCSGESATSPATSQTTLPIATVSTVRESFFGDSISRRADVIEPEPDPRESQSWHPRRAHLRRATTCAYCEIAARRLRHPSSARPRFELRCPALISGTTRENWGNKRSPFPSTLFLVGIDIVP